MVDETVYGCVRARWIGVGAHGCDGGGVGRARGARDAFQTRADGGARDVIERAREREACGRVCEWCMFLKYFVLTNSTCARAMDV